MEKYNEIQLTNQNGHEQPKNEKSSSLPRLPLAHILSKEERQTLTYSTTYR